MIQLIFAHNGYNFGAEDGMPWKHISEDFKNFKMRTEGSTLIMGAKTFESLPGLLPGRKHVVICDPCRPKPICKNGSLAHQYMSINSFERILTNHEDSDRMFSVIGGKALLEYALNYASIVVKTKINLHPYEAKPCTQWLTPEFLNLIESSEQIEENYVKIDSTTSINEQVFKLK